MLQFSLDSIQQTHAFLHQKWRIYQYSNSPQQREDIEWAIAQYVEQMNQELYAHLANGRADYLLLHDSFAADISESVDVLEKLMENC